MFSMTTIATARFHSTKFAHDKDGPLPGLPSLNAIPKLVFDQFTRVREAKDALLEDKSWCNANPPLITHGHLIPMDHMKVASLPTHNRSHTCDQ